MAVPQQEFPEVTSTIGPSEGIRSQKLSCSETAAEYPWQSHFEYRKM